MTGETPDLTNTPDMFEPNAYFQILKDGITEIEKKTITDGLAFIKAEYLKADQLGQRTLRDTISVMHDTLEKEVVLHSLGIKRVIDRQLVMDYIEKVEPKDSVKVVELEFFPRNIPEKNAAEIKRVRDLKLFDEIIIVYTDFTKQEVKTAEHQAMVNRNRDPIAFGMFHKDSIGFLHDRLYVITDWEDEYCDLTFVRMISRMQDLKIPVVQNETFVMAPTAKSFNEQIKRNVAEIDKNSKASLRQMNPKPQSIFARARKAIFG